jgi:hypothetical protein
MWAVLVICSKSKIFKLEANDQMVHSKFECDTTGVEFCRVSGIASSHNAS